MRSRGQTGPFELGHEPHSDLHSPAPLDTQSVCSVSFPSTHWVVTSYSQRWKGGEKGQRTQILEQTILGMTLTLELTRRVILGKLLHLGLLTHQREHYILVGKT